MRRDLLVGSLVLLLGACSTSGTLVSPMDGSVDATFDAGDGGLDGPDSGGPIIYGISITRSQVSVLAATITFSTDRPAVGTATFVNTGDGGADNTLTTPPEPALVTTHAIPVIGMRGGSPFQIHVVATDAQGRTSSAAIDYTTLPLPTWLPPITTVMNDKTRTSPGYTMINVLQWTGLVAQPYGVGSAFIALDQDFQIVWYYPSTNLDVEKLPNGNLVTPNGGWSEIDMLGNHLTGETAGTLHVDLLSHAIQPESSESALSITTDFRYISGYPDGGGNITNGVVGAKLVEVNLLDGGVARVISDAFDIFDVYDVQNPTLFKQTPWARVYPNVEGGAKDWIHGNAIVRDPSDNNIVASARSQNWIFKVNSADGGLMWKLGMGGDFALTNPTDAGADASWVFGQHGSYINPLGHIMVFDDGYGRPVDSSCSESDAGGDGCLYSRAVEYAIDATAKTASIVWQYGSPSPGAPDNFYSQIYGSVYLLPGPAGGQRTVLIDDGCEMATRASIVVDQGDLKSARVFELTYPDNVKVAEFDIRVPFGGYAPDSTFSGFSIYRAFRIPSLYGGSLGSQDQGDASSTP